MTYPLPERNAGDSGHTSVDHAGLTEFYNMMMTHFDGERATPFAVNVQHPDFGAVGDGVTDDAAALNAASDFAKSPGTGNELKRKVWLPRATYAVGETWIWHQYADIMGSLSTVKALPAFDFDTETASAIGTMPHAVVECHNLNNGPDPTRLAMGRFYSDSVIIDCNVQDGSNGFAGCLQQQSFHRSLRINNYRNRALWLAGQQGIFIDTMIIGESADPGLTHEMTGLYLGSPDEGASFMWFYGLNFERFHRGVWSTALNDLPGENHFNDVHFETDSGGGTGYSDDPDNPVVGYEIDRQHVVLGGVQWFSSALSGGTFLRAGFSGRAAADYGYDISRARIYGSGPPNDAVFIEDIGRGWLIRGWGETRLSQLDPPDEGIARNADHVSAPNLGDGAWPRYFRQYLGINGQRTAFSMYHPNQTDVDEYPQFRLEAGSTQVGDLLRVKGKAGNEAFAVVAEGLPELPAFTTPPTATNRKGQMYYDLDDDKVYYSNGTAWVPMT